MAGQRDVTPWMKFGFVFRKFQLTFEVPTHFHKNIFVMAGVDSDKLKVIPEPVDTDFFDPNRAMKPYPLENAANLKYKFLSVFKVSHTQTLTLS
jgi:hypothetical protein